MRKAFIMASILLSMLQAGTASAVTENSVASNEQLTSAAWTNLREIAKLRPIVRVVHIDTSSPSGITRENILRLIPSAKEGDVRLSRLEKELQLVSDGGLPVTALLKEASSGCSLLIIAGAPSETLSVEKPDDGTSKTSTAWQRGNITNRGDSFGINYSTLPGQPYGKGRGSISYRGLLPRLSDTWTLQFKGSNLDLGDIDSSEGLFDITSDGRSSSASIGYQHNMTYSERTKDILGLTIGKHSYSDNDTRLYVDGNRLRYDFDITDFALTYHHTNAFGPHNFSMNLGWRGSLSPSSGAGAVTPGSDKSYHLLQANAAYNFSKKDGWEMGLNLHGQYSSNHLAASEQLGAGSAYSIHAFGDAIMSSDSGFIGSLSITTPEWLPCTRFRLFSDYADLTNNLYGGNLFRHGKLSTTGIGWHYSRDDNFSLDYYYAISDPSGLTGTEEPERRKWALSLSTKF